MPRFTASSYKTGGGGHSPAKDSSPGYAGLQRATGAVVLRVPEEGCPCGCGIKHGDVYLTDSGRQQTFGDRAAFCMGHDARLRGKLIRAHLTDTPIVIVGDEEAAEPVPAMEIAATYDWERYLQEAVARRDRANKALLSDALNSTRLIKVGRWSYSGQVVAIFGEEGDQMYDIKYVTKQGDTKTVRVSASEAPLAV